MLCVLHFHNDRQNHGVPLGLFKEVIGDLVPEVALHGVPVPVVVPGALFQRLGRQVLQLLHQGFGLLHVDEAPGDNVGAGQEPAVLAGHGGHHHDHAVLGQVLSVPEDHSPYVAHAVAVHKDPPGGDSARDPSSGGRELYDLTDLGYAYVGRL